jgi:hypothetical protein
VPDAGRRVHGAQHGERGQGPRFGVQDVGGAGRRGDGQDRAGGGPVEGQRRAAEDDQGVVDGRGVGVGGGRGEHEGTDHDREDRVEKVTAGDPAP